MDQLLVLYLGIYVASLPNIPQGILTIMEALEVDDISPALEVTEDFFSTFDTKLENVQPPEVYGVQEVPELVGHEVLDKITACADLRNLSPLGKNNLVWGHCKNGLLETKVQTAFPAKEQLQRAMVPDNLSWVEQREASTFNIFNNICQRRRDRPRSVNDIIVQSEETAPFKPGHNRSRSDISRIDWGVVLANASQQQPTNQGNRCPKLSFLPSGLKKEEDSQGNTGKSGLTFLFGIHLCLKLEIVGQPGSHMQTGQKEPFKEVIYNIYW